MHRPGLRVDGNGGGMSYAHYRLALVRWRIRRDPRTSTRVRAADAAHKGWTVHMVANDLADEDRRTA